MDPITMALLGLAGAKTIFGIAQAAKAQNTLRNLSMPQYQMPSEISEATNIYRNMASASKMPGQEYAEARLNEAMAEGINEARKYSPSSVAMMGTVTDLAKKKMQAIQDLAGAFAEYKAKREAELARSLQTQADYKDLEFKLNKYDPYFIKRNELVSQKNAGVSNIFEGTTDLMGVLASYQGTKSFLDVLRDLYPSYLPAPAKSPQLPIPTINPPSFQSYKGIINK